MFVSCSASLATAQSPAPSPTPITSLAGVPCTEPVKISPDDAFAHEITDPRTLAFLSFVQDIAPRERVAVRRRAAAPVAKTEIDELDRGLAADCSFEEVDYRTSRLVYMVARIWSGHEALDIQDAVRHAIAALYLQDRISEQTRDATLAVFGTSVTQLDARVATSAAPPASTDPDPCARRIDARAIEPTQPFYPLDARANGVSGVVSVEVDMDEHGYVRSATLFKEDVNPPGARGDDLATQTIISAATTHYAPEFVDCKPRAGRYLFRAEYSRR
jgi:hypothetical protein